MTLYRSRANQQGYFLLLAVIFVMVIGSMGSIIAYTYSARARMSVAQQNGLRVFYLAETGLEVASRLLTGTNLVGGQALTCDTLTGAPLVTNASALTGTFTATAVGGGLYSGSSTLSTSITAASNSMSLASVTGFAPHGRVRIGNEAIDYASISGSTLVGLNRGVGGTTAASHAANIAVSQSVCLVNVDAGIPSIAAPQYQRSLQMAVEILSGGSDIWAVGDRRGNRFSFIRWDTPTADAWNDYSFRDRADREDLLAVSPSSTINAWAVGSENNNNFTAVNWNGNDWQEASFGGACNGQDLTGVSTISTAEAWAVGVRYRPGCSGGGNYRYTILRWNGASWSLLTPSSSPSIPADAAGNQNLNAISMIDSNGNGTADFGFAVGDQGVILRYTGAAWVSSPSGSGDNLMGVSTVSASEAWVVTDNGKILKWNGSSWTSVPTPTGQALRAVNMLDTNGDGVADVGWAVGDSGGIIYYNGSVWSNRATPTNRDLHGVVTVNGSSAWAVGESRTIVQWNGSNWNLVSSPINGQLNAIGIIRGVVAGSGTPVGSWSQGSG